MIVALQDYYHYVRKKGEKMSVLIKGMDMPKGNSTKTVLIYSDGTVFTGHKNNSQYSAIEFEPEPQKGKWIDRGKDYMIRWICSECGRKNMYIDNFCSNCGADMRGEQE